MEIGVTHDGKPINTGVFVVIDSLRESIAVSKNWISLVNFGNRYMKGNSPERWNKLLEALDEKLQLNLLDHLRKVAGYHFEEDILYIEPTTSEEEDFFKRDAVFQQLQLFAQDVIKVDKVKIKRG